MKTSKILIISVVLLLGYLLKPNLMGPPEGLEIESGIANQTLTGSWYEIARKDNKIEKDHAYIHILMQSDQDGLKLTMSEPAQEGGDKSPWESSMKLTELDTEISGYRYSCAWIFSCGLHLIDLDKANRDWIVVIGHQTNLVWILSRSQALAPEILGRILENLEGKGINTDDMMLFNGKAGTPQPPEDKAVKGPKPTNRILPALNANRPAPAIPSAPMELPFVPSDHVPQVPATIPEVPMTQPPAGPSGQIPSAPNGPSIQR